MFHLTVFLSVVFYLTILVRCVVFQLFQLTSMARWFSTDKHFEFSVFFNGLLEVPLVDDSSMISSEFVNDV